METERWREIESLYHQALEREQSQRAPFLEQACGVDQSLQLEVESLLAQSEEAEGFLEAPALDVAARALAATPRPFPAAIGRYRIVRLLGEGGMGTVYEAEQEQPRRGVALKVIRPGLATPERLWRFQHESQALGRLQHPGIAQIYEASTADTGFGPQPYFAMELVRGHPLRQYAETNRLNARQRLALMVKVCEAVHHAHQRGVIHRDLKPGNILVDETGQPKILDFGVSRVTESDARETRQTDVGQMVGTLAYMSPEQVLADPLEVDTRSDVYSLGVILYELLSGKLPYEVSGRQLHEAVEAIREQDPTPLGSLGREYRGDIETIVGKALEKDKARRYASAAELAADIGRYLSDELIMARPPSAGYQLQKFARRRRALVAGVAAVFVALLAGVAASTYQAIRANRAGQAALLDRDRAAAAERAATQARDRALRAQQAATSERNRAVAAEAQAVQARNRAIAEKQRADEETATAKAVSSFLQDDLLAQAGAGAQARPDIKPDPDLKVRTALDRAASGIQRKFDKQPLVEASIRQTIGNAYLDLGIYPEAQKQMERALGLRRRLLGEDDPQTQASMLDLATLCRAEANYARAESLRTRVLEIRRRLLGENHPDTLRAMNDLAVLYRNDAKFAEAQSLQAKVLEIQRRALGEDHPDTLVSMSILAAQDQLDGKYAEAEPLVSKVLEVRRRVLGGEHPNTLRSMNDLAGLYRSLGKYAAAERLSLEVLAIERRVLGENHPDTLRSMYQLVLLYLSQRKYTVAEPIVTKVLEIERRVLGPQHPETVAAMDSLGWVHMQQGNFVRAEKLFREHLTIYEKIAPDAWSRYYSQALLGASLAGQERYAEAEPLLVSGVQGMMQREATIPPTYRFMVALAGASVVQLYQSWGKPEKAAEWREKLQAK